MIKGDGSVIHFNNPKVQASLSANTFAVTGHAETKRMFHAFVYTSLHTVYLCHILTCLAIFHMCC